MVRRTAAADERSGVESRAQPPLRPSARHDARRQNADARRPRAALSRHRPRLPRRATPGGAGRSLCRTAFAAGGRTADSNSMRASKLGAVGSDLAAISWFFDRPYETPAAALTPPDARFCPQRGQLRVARARASPGGAAGDARAACTWMKRRRDWTKRGDRRVKSERNRTSGRRHRRRRGDGGKVCGACGPQRRSHFR